MRRAAILPFVLLAAVSLLRAAEPDAFAVSARNSTPRPVAVGFKPEPGDKIFSGKKSLKVSLSAAVELTLGSESVVQVVAAKDGSLELWLVKGRVRTGISSEDRLVVRTAAGRLTTGKGVCDIMIANLNTLAIAREGSALAAETSLKEVCALPGFYVLLTTEGAISVTRLTGD